MPHRLLQGALRVEVRRGQPAGTQRQRRAAEAPGSLRVRREAQGDPEGAGGHPEDGGRQDHRATPQGAGREGQGGQEGGGGQRAEGRLQGRGGEDRRGEAGGAAGAGGCAALPARGAAGVQLHPQEGHRGDQVQSEAGGHHQAHVRWPSHLAEQARRGGESGDQAHQQGHRELHPRLVREVRKEGDPLQHELPEGRPGLRREREGQYQRRDLRAPRALPALPPGRGEELEPVCLPGPPARARGQGQRRRRGAVQVRGRHGAVPLRRQDHQAQDRRPEGRGGQARQGRGRAERRRDGAAEGARRGGGARRGAGAGARHDDGAEGERGRDAEPDGEGEPAAERPLRREHAVDGGCEELRAAEEAPGGRRGMRRGVRRLLRAVQLGVPRRAAPGLCEGDARERGARARQAGAGVLPGRPGHGGRVGPGRPAERRAVHPERHHGHPLLAVPADDRPAGAGESMDQEQGEDEDLAKPRHVRHHPEQQEAERSGGVHDGGGPVSVDRECGE
mmetsp:Transcript_71714/g.200122  ORF Transcript_71714/g.200122 Transcript_71714/m.200122 type:complete len:505 (+) Transcript_71714:1540-3054(+)